MVYTEIIVKTKHDYADIVSAILLEEGSQGVSVEDFRDVLETLRDKRNWDYADESLLNARCTGEAVVKGFNIGGESLARVIAELDRLKEFNTDFSYSVATQVRDDAEYKDVWKQYFKPITVGALNVVPVWEADSFRGEGVSVLIDPGLAFGTGTHETTYMCLRLLSGIDCKGKSVLDVGCGSGILGLGAAALGAAIVNMIDNDASAVSAALSNTRVNNMDNLINVKHGVLDENDACADIIVANITAHILCLISADVAAHLKDGATLILSGIIEGRQSEVEDCYTKLGLEIVSRLNMGDWHALMLRSAR